MSNLTYVTSFFKIYDNKCESDITYRFSKFLEIVNSGIQICLYIDQSCVELFKDFDKPNVKIMNVTDITETWVYQEYYKNINENVNEPPINLPHFRNYDKDTEKYMIIMNSKIDLVKDAIDKNPFNSSHFAWIDYSISYIFKNINSCNHLLNVYSYVKLVDKFLCIPGCLDKICMDDVESYTNRVNWRFCGGFFMGDKESLCEFHTLHRDNFNIFLSKYKKLVWEVNYWAWIEATVNSWNPTWFKADHNETILNIPSIFYSHSLKELCFSDKKNEAITAIEREENEKTSTDIGSDISPIDERYQTILYDYPIIEGFTPSSASHLYTNMGDSYKHILNTRYVNYIIENGVYKYYDSARRIISRNLFSILDNETFLPTSFINVDESDVGITSKYNNWSEGLEDVRLFTFDKVDKISPTEANFIATSANYSNQSHNRMILGKYVIDEENKKVNIKECSVLSSPHENVMCEKNWIPISEGKYIYKWSPYEIIELDEDNKWKINKHIEDEIVQIISPICKRFRGSTTFIETGDELLGIVHFTEGEGVNLCYLHCFVTLDKETLKPLRYTQPFFFDKKQIEYCIGFYIKKGVDGGKDKYCLWISRVDREPMLIVSDVPELKWFSV